MAYHRQQGVDTAIVRIFNTYGPADAPDDGRAIPTFVRQALEDEPLTVFGDGSQTRSFCYVDDLIRGLILLAESGEHLPVNIGNPDEFTLLELAQTVIALTGSKSEIVYEALPVDDPQVRQPDITRARQLLGWEPEVELEEGLRRMLAVARAGAGRCVGGVAIALVAHRSRLAALGAPSRRSRARTCSSGIFDDAQIALRQPGQDVPDARQAAHRRSSGSTSTGAASRRREDAARAPDRPGRSRVRLDALRPRRPLRGQVQDPGRCSRSTARRAGRTAKQGPQPRAEEIADPAAVRLRGGEALQRHLQAQ